MNITKALTLALKVAAKRASVPVLNCARVSITDGTLALSATDCDHYITLFCDATGSADVAPRVVPLKTLQALVKGAPHTDIGTLITSLAPACEPGEWWEEPIYTVQGTVTMAAPAWRDMLQTVGSAMSTEETRYYLNGIHIDKEGEAVATDGHRLARLRLPDGAVDLSENIIVPRYAVTLLDQILARDTNTRTLALCSTDDNRGTWVRLVTPTIHYASRIVDGTFPDYRRVIPTSTASTIIMRVDTLAGHGAALARLYGRRDMGKAVVTYCSISATTEMGASADLSLPVFDAVASDKYVPVAFQAGYLAALGAAFPTGATVTLAMEDNLSPVLITSVQAPGFTYVLMPMRK